MRSGSNRDRENLSGVYGHKARNFDWDPIRGSHQGQRHVAASTGRTHDLHPTGAEPNARFSLQRGRRPHMTLSDIRVWEWTASAEQAASERAPR